MMLLHKQMTSIQSLLMTMPVALVDRAIYDFILVNSSTQYDGTHRVVFI